MSVVLPESEPHIMLRDRACLLDVVSDKIHDSTSTGWEKLADKLGFKTHDQLVKIKNEADCNRKVACYQLLQTWQRRDGSTLFQLKAALKDIQRFDVIRAIDRTLAEKSYATCFIETLQGRKENKEVEYGPEDSLREAFQAALAPRFDVDCLDIVGPAGHGEITWDSKVSNNQGQTFSFKENRNVFGTTPPSSQLRQMALVSPSIRPPSDTPILSGTSTALTSLMDLRSDYHGPSSSHETPLKTPVTTPLTTPLITQVKPPVQQNNGTQRAEVVDPEEQSLLNLRPDYLRSSSSFEMPPPVPQNNGAQREEVVDPEEQLVYDDAQSMPSTFQPSFPFSLKGPPTEAPFNSIPKPSPGQQIHAAPAYLDQRNEQQIPRTGQQMQRTGPQIPRTGLFNPRTGQQAPRIEPQTMALEDKSLPCKTSPTSPPNRIKPSTQADSVSGAQDVRERTHAPTNGTNMEPWRPGQGQRHRHAQGPGRGQRQVQIPPRSRVEHGWQRQIGGRQVENATYESLITPFDAMIASIPNDTPGWYPNFPDRLRKRKVKAMLKEYLGEDGAYLLRPHTEDQDNNTPQREAKKTIMVTVTSGESYRHFIIHWQQDSAGAFQYYFYRGGALSRDIIGLILHHGDEDLVDPRLPRDQQEPIRFKFPVQRAIPDDV